MADEDPLAFTPVPTSRARHNGWTPERQRRFIAALAMIGLVSVAAREVGMSAKSAYALRKRAGAEEFAIAWDRAVGSGQAHARSTAVERAIHGTLVPVFHRGKRVGARRVFDNKLLVVALRAFAAPGTLGPAFSRDRLDDPA
ncbi:hypothetical protein GGQ80_000836 [Sphingomonas jinjuensis]|uniref:Uncharacterized protein n=1 Tax=Sphingomonas jinjuensis TaxID=535907 RepID=A0A840FG26_9SPHN|nr:hypothetical protein [Sphingomonas jinjuensis]MBB4152948.1 hypothetical protein [Sphingomonas jinjuensis]